MNTQIYKYNETSDSIYFFYGFGGVTFVIGLLFLLAPFLFPLALVFFGFFLIITGIASFIEGFLLRGLHH